MDDLSGSRVLGSPPHGGGGRLTALPNDLVEKMLEELKSQGTFDQIRKDCLAESEIKPAYQNLRQRVEGTLSRFLDKEVGASWKPTMNKAQLRNKLKKYVQESSYMDSGIERIVDQLVNPKIATAIEPEVETVVYSYLGVDKVEEESVKPEVAAKVSDQTSPREERHSPPAAVSQQPTEERDIEMKSEGSLDTHSNQGFPDNREPLSDESGPEVEKSLQERTMSEASSSPGPGLKGNISPLTPERPSSRQSNQSSNLELHMSPTTPPLPPAATTTSPGTPPMPPPRHQIEFFFQEDGVVQEEVVERTSMSPVSDTDLAEISPPGESPITPDECSLPSPPSVPPLPPQPPGDPYERFAGTPPLPPPPLPPPSPPSSSSLPPPLPPPSPSEERPPPPPRSKRSPRYPPTSPIGSSDDGMDVDEAPAPKSSKKDSGPSDISDTDLPSGASGKESEEDEDDLESLERTAELLKAKLAAGASDDEDEGEDDSDGEVRSDEEERSAYMKRFDEICRGEASVESTSAQKDEAPKDSIGDGAEAE